VFYDNSEDFEEILATVTFFMQQNPNMKFITAYHKRSSQRTLDFLLLKWGLVVEKEISSDVFFPQHKYHTKDMDSKNESWSSIWILHIATGKS